ncbi:MAG: hypothetical protein OEM52_02450 [bacterium]|nr:hypothetical protein [bacterium]
MKRLVIPILLLFSVSYAIGSSNELLLKKLSTESGWVKEQTYPSGWTHSKRTIDGFESPALAISGETNAPAELIAEVVYDVPAYNRFLTAASRLQAGIVVQDSSVQIGYQRWDIPLLPDRYFFYRMKKSRAGDTLFLQWTLETPANLALTNSLSMKVMNDASIIEIGAGQWILVSKSDGGTLVDYRLSMASSGALSGWVLDYINKKGILTQVEDVTAEAKRRNYR